MSAKKIILYLGGLLTLFFAEIPSEVSAQEIKLALSSEVRESPVLMPVEVEFRMTNISDRAISGIPRL